jgi:NTP pyrophosphatase (non-canonical NTP hydrolase)
MSYPSHDLSFNQYQEKAKETAIYPQVGNTLNLYPFLGLSGETGEVLEKVKKIYRDKNGHLSEDDKRELLKELGDILWYLSAIVSDMEEELETVAQMNIDKLSSRKNRDVLHGDGDNR